MSSYTANSSDYIRGLFNGPAIAGVGATTDAGLPAAKHHVLPYKIGKTVDLRWSNDKWEIDANDFTGNISAELAFKAARFNVQKILKFDVATSAINGINDNLKDQLYLDTVAIIFLMISYNLYRNEAREATVAEATEIDNINTDRIGEVLTVERLNRAATYIAARIHTKYQTNHAVGGNPMQASMAAVSRAFLDIVVGTARNDTARDSQRVATDCLYWALHPVNEAFLLPAIIANTHIEACSVFKDGPAPTLLQVDEFFNIRLRTFPASTHHYFTAHAACVLLEPLGVLDYLPEPTRLNHVKNGFLLVASHGARLHPAAAYWGLKRQTANQKIIEPLCQDLGYAVRKLLPASSLAEAPVLRKSDNINTAWKGFIDSIASYIDAAGEKILDASVLNAVKDRIAPAAGGSAYVKELMDASRITAGITATHEYEYDEDEHDLSQATPSAEDPHISITSSAFPDSKNNLVLIPRVLLGKPYAFPDESTVYVYKVKKSDVDGVKEEDGVKYAELDNSICITKDAAGRYVDAIGNMYVTDEDLLGA